MEHTHYRTEEFTLKERSESGAEQPTSPSVNMGSADRWISLAAGVLLLGRFARHRSLLSALGAGSLLYRGYTRHCPLYAQLGLSTQGGRTALRQSGQHVSESIHINLPREELFRFWHDLENLPRVMGHLISVTRFKDGRSKWRARTPLGTTVGWMAETTAEQPYERIAWAALPDSEVQCSGEVIFRDSAGGHGTELTVSMDYLPVGGKPVAKALELMGQGLQKELEEDLRNFKRLVEAGERPVPSLRTEFAAPETEPPGQPLAESRFVR